MSRSTEQKYPERITDLKTGSHLVMIKNLSYLKIQMDKFPVMSVLFENDKNEVYEHWFVLDNDWRQEVFQKLLVTIGALLKEGQPTKEDILGKRLYLFIKEVHHINDDTPIVDENGPVIEYFMFNFAPFINGMKKPKTPGDPADDNGIPSGKFINYKNLSLQQKGKTEEEVIDEQVIAAEYLKNHPKVEMGKKVQEKINKVITKETGSLEIDF